MYKFYQLSNIGNCYCLKLFRYTTGLYQAPSEIVESPKLREREHENGRKLGTIPYSPSQALIFSCVFHLRVTPTTV